MSGSTPIEHVTSSKERPDFFSNTKPVISDASEQKASIESIKHKLFFDEGAADMNIVQYPSEIASSIIETQGREEEELYTKLNKLSALCEKQTPRSIS